MMPIHICSKCGDQYKYGLHKPVCDILCHGCKDDQIIFDLLNPANLLGLLLVFIGLLVILSTYIHENF